MNNMFVQNGQLKDVANKTVILKGVNVDANKSSFEDIWQLDEIALSGANAVRINWWANWKGQIGPFPFTVNNLERILNKCKQHQLVAIISLHDVTCKTNSNRDFEEQIMRFWLSDAIVGLVQKFQNRVIINIANEFGKVKWMNNPEKAWRDYFNIYKKAIARIRAKKMQVPLMIDAPDCGTSSEVFIQHSRELLQVDPLQNIIFSVHTYWQSLLLSQINQQLDAMKATGQCFVLGEIANIQGDSENMENNFDLAAAGKMDAIASKAQNNEIGFLWWLWWNDGVKLRQLTNDGTFGNLTQQGITVLTSTKTYSFKKSAITKANF